jgi:hypothetical protein
MSSNVCVLVSVHLKGSVMYFNTLTLFVFPVYQDRRQVIADKQNASVTGLE